MSAPRINDRAQAGFANSTAYDSHRPAYSDTITQVLLEQLDVEGKQGAVVVDLAAGTGKFTEALAKREEGFRIIAVEPHHDMRKVLEGKQLKGVSVVDGVADSMSSLEDESVDALTIAQSFHWFANMDSLKEFHRVLQPHGRLGLVWNVEDWNAPKNHKASTAWEKVAHDLNFAIAEESGDDQPRFRHQEWRKVFDEQIKVTPLTILKASDDQLFSLPIGEHVEPFEVALPVEDAWKRFRTLGQISVIEGERLERAKKTFMDAINGGDVEKNENGDVIIHGNSYAYWTSKIPAEGRDGVFSVEHSKE
ncbi:2-heptaprenyl-1 4-naphthoquinone methyltransferase like protein [Zymoseptoria brevis]|uniref:2-heptaprenyl-1 4-naphthoquinone methyltransferase like protein n=1 Tax=Zymoseptoria brevis TaxID=1047168 RepID=A0A0F4GEE9_9PEZI|nr:2-heptaprenyl-1 4-naphthoquinone methyltransferase like protein [Zymoseptoria brevis]